MSPQAQQLQIEYLQGQITGMQAAIRGLVRANADPVSAAAIVAESLELITARGLASPTATETMLLGLTRSKDLLLPGRHDAAPATLAERPVQSADGC